VSTALRVLVTRAAAGRRYVLVVGVASERLSLVVRPTRIEWIEDEARFHALGAEWDALADLEGSPFLRHAWFRSWWAVYGSGRRLRVCALWDGDERAALLPLWANGRRLEAVADSIAPAFKPFGRDEGAVRGVVRAALDTGADELLLWSVSIARRRPSRRSPGNAAGSSTRSPSAARRS
jgi:hypothetical protein